MREKNNRRQRVLAGLIFSVIFLAVVCIGGILCKQEAAATDFSRKNLAPCTEYLFGTDWLGRDMFARTLRGLSVSILLGMVSAAVSAAAAFVLGVISAAMGRTADSAVSFCIDWVMGIPHILLLILISVALGKGFRGVAAGVALTHWPSLARVIRAEMIQLKESPYIQIAEKLGKRKGYLIRKHMLPHLMPQFFVGLVLLFPHAILHESSVTFLGFGLSSEQPAIGIILSESMRYLVTGQWWLAAFPGAMLVLVVILFYEIGENLRKLLSPGSAHE
ncbi:ABC transporter permease [Mediterraneibacter agrestimuris]|uniref:ABC transporter permease n=1 Tax=Mediterraneibacter agrestimuris TaxID=2941333 RepID=UPI00203DE54E|nr:ABC transporter permease [Mediterraneibacter agrestimuris]